MKTLCEDFSTFMRMLMGLPSEPLPKGACGPTRTLCEPHDKLEASEHKHRCGDCCIVWKHGDLTVAHVDDFNEGHSCPQCGKEVRTKYYGETV